MRNGGLVPSSSTSQQTPETMLYDTLIPKKQTVSTKYDSFRNQQLCQSSCIEEVGCDHMIVTFN